MPMWTGVRRSTISNRNFFLKEKEPRLTAKNKLKTKVLVDWVIIQADHNDVQEKADKTLPLDTG